MAAKTQENPKFQPVVVNVETGDDLAPPAWATDLVAAGSPAVGGEANVTIELTDGGDFALASARLRDAVALDAPTLERRVTGIYDAIATRLRPLAANQLVRLWNHIPSIHERMDARRDRYMVFNAG